MSQRDSGYARKERDLYETPGWVTNALMQYVPLNARIWEPACGSGKMVNEMQVSHRVVKATDIETGADFLLWAEAPAEVTAIITNPPYNLATEFCEQALRLMEQRNGFVAMLLRTDFDHAKSRFHLFRDCPAFCTKIVLTCRIAWFVEDNGKPKASPSYNHAWYIWDWTHDGPPTIAYA